MTQLPKVTQAALRMLEMSTGEANCDLERATLRFPSQRSLSVAAGELAGALPTSMLKSTKQAHSCACLVLKCEECARYSAVAAAQRGADMK